MVKMKYLENVLRPQLSASKIFLGCTILILSILCVSAHSSVSNLGHTLMVQIIPRGREGTDVKIWIKSIWFIQEKFGLKKVGDVVVDPFIIS